MLTTEELVEEQGEQMQTVTLGNTRRGIGACTHFGMQLELALLDDDDASCACVADLIRIAERKSHRCPLQQSLVETANQDSNRHRRYQ